MNERSRPTQVPSHLNAVELKEFVCRLFPRVKTFHYAKGLQGQTQYEIINEEVNPTTLSKIFNRSKVYILPLTLNDEIISAQTDTPLEANIGSTDMSPSTSYRDRSMNASLPPNTSATILPLSISTPSHSNSQGSLLDQWNKLVELSKTTPIRRQVSSNRPSTSTALKPTTIFSRSAHDDQLSTATDQAAPKSEESSSSANSSMKPNDINTIQSSTSSNPADLSNIASTSSSLESTSSVSGNAPGHHPSSTSPLSQTTNVTSENTAKSTNNKPAARSDETTSGSAIPAPNIESSKASSSSSTGNENFTLCEEGHSYVENGVCLICAPRKAAEESERIDRERAEQKVI